MDPRAFLLCVPLPYVDLDVALGLWDLHGPVSGVSAPKTKP